MTGGHTKCQITKWLASSTQSRNSCWWKWFDIA